MRLQRRNLLALARAAIAAAGLAILPVSTGWAQPVPAAPRPSDPLQRVPQAPQLPRSLPAPMPPPAAAPQIVVETPMLVVNSAKRFTGVQIEVPVLVVISAKRFTPVQIEVPVLIVNSSKTTPRR